MNEFKFFARHIAIAHDGGYIFAGEYFYTMNKEEMVSASGKIIPKYIIVKRIVSKEFKDQFKPDHEALWYFKHFSNALDKRMEELNDREVENMLKWDINN